MEETVNQWVNEDPAERLLEKLWISEVLEKPVSENLTELLQTADPASRRTLLRSLWHQRQEMGEDAIPGLVQFMMKQTQHADARIRMEAVASLGQLDGTSSLRPLTQYSRQPRKRLMTTLILRSGNPFGNWINLLVPARS